MDIEMAKKVNELAREMVNRGMATSSSEASAMAEQALKTELPKESSVKTDENYEIMMERVQRKVSNEVSGLKEQISSIVNQLDMIRQEVNNIKKSKIVEKPVEKQEVVKEEVKEEKVAEKKESNQRTGDFKSEDVDINKIFYYGQK